MATATVVQQQPEGSQGDGAPKVIVMQAGGGQGSAPPGVAAGGQWIQEKYCGPITWVIGLCLFWPVVCCPCDNRMVYMMNGVKYNMQGHVVSSCC